MYIYVNIGYTEDNKLRIIILIRYTLKRRTKSFVMALSKGNGSFSLQENMSFTNVIENHVLGTKYVKKKKSNTTVQQSQHSSKSSALWGLITKETFTRTPVEGVHESESDSEEEDFKPSSSGLLYKQTVQLSYSKTIVRK